MSIVEQAAAAAAIVAVQWLLTVAPLLCFGRRLARGLSQLRQAVVEWHEGLDAGDDAQTRLLEKLDEIDDALRDAGRLAVSTAALDKSMARLKREVRDAARSDVERRLRKFKKPDERLAFLMMASGYGRPEVEAATCALQAPLTAADLMTEFVRVLASSPDVASLHYGEIVSLATHVGGGQIDRRGLSVLREACERRKDGAEVIMLFRAQLGEAGEG